MKKYALTSTNFSGEMHYTYDANGLLLVVEFVGIVEPAMHAALCKQIPATQNNLLKWREISNKLTITEINTVVSFENFYKQYNYKVGKKEAESAWKRLSEADKIKAISQIPIYDKWVKEKGIAKAYPSTYLNKERFNDEFK